MSLPYYCQTCGVEVKLPTTAAVTPCYRCGGTLFGSMKPLDERGVKDEQTLETIVTQAWDDYCAYLKALPEDSASLPAPAWLWRWLAQHVVVGQ